MTATRTTPSTLAKLKELADDLPKAMRATIEKMRSEQMEAEVSAQIGAGHQERSSTSSTTTRGSRRLGVDGQVLLQGQGASRRV